jgi:G:T-mismatch repair DNA endonuclease (very short patch repair protein)
MEKWTCRYCHVENNYKNKYTVSSHISRCQDWKKWKRENLSEEFLIKRYVNEEASLPEIAEELGLVSVTAVYNQLKKFKIKIRTVKEACPNSKKKAEKTNLIRYGARHNLSPGHPVRVAYDAKILAEYGAINTFQLESIKNKIKESLLEKYGYEYTCQIPYVKEKVKKTMMERYGTNCPLDLVRSKNTYTKIHQKVFNWLKEGGYNVDVELNVKDENGKYYYFDVYFNDNKKLIEVNGDFYHGNPRFYSKNDTIKIYGVVKTAEELWNKDFEKTKFAEKLGYSVLSVWEYDIDNDFDSVKKQILEFLKK